MVIAQAVSYGAHMLTGIVENPRLEARVLLCHCLRLDAASLLRRNKDLFPSAVLPEYKALLNRRIKREPLAYLIGEKEFMSLSFAVTPAVLIPRPDTECLVEWVLEHFIGKSILDIGTGSGCIAVSLAHYIGDVSITALDISPEALAIAQENARRNHADVSFLQLDILKDVPEGTYDCIVSNPPYIRPEVISSLEKDVRSYEPYEALYGGDDGLQFYRRICALAPGLLNDNGTVALEIGYDQGHAVASLLAESFTKIEIHKDYGGNDRVVTAEKKHGV